MGFHIAVQDPPPAVGPGGQALEAFRALIGNSHPHNELLQRCSRFGQSGLRDILLVGGPGTGKSLLARAIHNASARSGEAFLSDDVEYTIAEANDRRVHRVRVRRLTPQKLA